jgi:hypothetical protein
MKYITSALVLIALFGNHEQVNAIRVKASFTDDLVKSLAEEMQKDVEEDPSAPAPAAQAAPAPAPGHVNNTKAASTPLAAAQKKAVVKKANTSNNTTQAAVQKKSVAIIKKKAEEEEIPMDAAAIKAYSSVIADAAEDSEP